MTHEFFKFRYIAAVTIAAITSLTASIAAAQNWVLLEARDLPAQCANPMSCLDQSTLAMRNLLSVAPDGRNALLQTLNQISTIRGLPEEAESQAKIGLRDMTEALHPLPISEELVPLVNHPGVYFDPSSLNANEVTAGFADYVISQLSAVGVRFLTEEELENTPGRPTLSVRFSARRESAGCIIPFSVSMAITEEAVMVRNPGLKISARAWSGLVRQNLANLNYTHKSALDELVAKFVSDWKEANPSN